MAPCLIKSLSEGLPALPRARSPYAVLRNVQHSNIGRLLGILVITLFTAKEAN